MSISRSNLLNRLAVLRDSLGDPSVSDGAPTEVKKNAVAGMLRNGVAVLAFAITEDFIRDRTAEALRGFASTMVKFSDLSESLQQAVTISALEGLLFRAKFQEKTNKVSWILKELPPIANAASNISDLSPFSFGQASSNLADDDPTKILSAFGVSGGWTTIAETAKRIGLGGILDYSQAFKDLAKRRHTAAHDVATKIPLNDLKDSVNTIIGICCAFDLLLSYALLKHNSGSIPSKKAAPIISGNLTLRFVSPHPTQAGKFREQIEASTGASLHTIKVHASLDDACKKAGAMAKTQNSYLVLLGSNGLPEKWETW